jgi:phosphatidylserine/phosphatidylglycerophosphate/cardiolipin synthase-like enzyme
MTALGERAAILARDLPEGIAELLLGVEPEHRSNPLALQTSLGLTSRQASDLASFSTEAASLAKHSVAAMMLEASSSARLHAMDEADRVSLVWTGPAIAGIAARQTILALRDLIASARHEILLIGYAFTRGAAPLVAEVDAAARRGVSVWLIANTPDQLRLFRRLPHGSVRASALASHGDIRPTLHAKVTIVDGARMLLTSANFTSSGFNWNVELGVLVEGGSVRDAVAVFTRLRDLGLLVDVSVTSAAPDGSREAPDKA